MSINQIKIQDRAIHDWYRFVLAYPPHLVREYLEKFNANPETDWIYDPFAGTATTPLEARLNGFSVIATDANPIAILANKVKLNWDINLEQIKQQVESVVQFAIEVMNSQNLEPFTNKDTVQISLLEADLAWGIAQTQELSTDHQIKSYTPEMYIHSDAQKIIPKNFISPKPMNKVLAIRYAIETIVTKNCIQDFMMLALANTMLSTAANVAFGPEVYATKPKEDAPVLIDFYHTVNQMIEDMQETLATLTEPPKPVYIEQDDARSLTSLSNKPQINFVITSPPYPNEKDYTRATRLENVLLGYLSSRKDLRNLKEHLLRSNSRNVFVNDNDDQYIKDIPSITQLAEQIECRRLELGKTSGFEKLYHRVTSLYFGGMYRHLAQLYPRIKPGGKCAYVVGDQMSFFRILIPTAHLLADVATKIGYNVEGIEIWRNRFSTRTKQHIEENVLILSKPE